MIRSCSIIIRKALGDEAATLGLRAAWAMLSGADIDVKVFLMGDGLYSALGKDGYQAGLLARFLGEDGQVYAVKEDMEERNLDAGLFPQGVTLLNTKDLFEAIDETDSVMTF